MSFRSRAYGKDSEDKIERLRRYWDDFAPRYRELSRAVDLQIGDAQSLAFPEGRFDTVVCTLSLCCVPDDRQAVAEMKRVLRPGGQLILLDHVRSDVRPIHAIQRLIEPIWIRSHSDSLLRRPLEHVEAEGFDIERHQRLKWGIVERVVARKPHTG